MLSRAIGSRCSIWPQRGAWAAASRREPERRKRISTGAPTLSASWSSRAGRMICIPFQNGPACSAVMRRYSGVRKQTAIRSSTVLSGSA
eukprot:15434626-Alexandrium_andersonii.AAC.1